MPSWQNIHWGNYLGINNYGGIHLLYYDFGICKDNARVFLNMCIHNGPVFIALMAELCLFTFVCLVFVKTMCMHL